MKAAWAAVCVMGAFAAGCVADVSDEDGAGGGMSSADLAAIDELLTEQAQREDKQHILDPLPDRPPYWYDPHTYPGGAWGSPPWSRGGGAGPAPRGGSGAIGISPAGFACAAAVIAFDAIAYETNYCERVWKAHRKGPIPEDRKKSCEDALSRGFKVAGIICAGI